MWVSFLLLFAVLEEGFRATTSTTTSTTTTTTTTPTTTSTTSTTTTTTPDPCLGNNCNGHGSCSNGICTCTAGYTDSTCSTNIQECSSSPCKNGAACNDGVDKYTCVCAGAWGGTNCDMPTCGVDTSCENGATCVMVHDNKEKLCLCDTGWQGKYCTEKHVNGESFYELKGCYKTTVVSGSECITRNSNNDPTDCWTQIQNEPSFSTSKAFLMKRKANHGDARYCCYSTSMPSTGVAATKCDQYNCKGDTSISCAGYCSSCNPEQYYALTYEVFYDVDKCVSKSLCGEDQNPANGYCIETLGASYDCLCYPGKTGLLCDTDIDECASNPCNYQTLNSALSVQPDTNGGDSKGCINGDNQYTCVCKTPLWSGTNCEKFDDCASNPCVHGICSQEADGQTNKYTCMCPEQNNLPEYYGTNCQKVDNCYFDASGGSLVQKNHTCVNGACVDGTDGWWISNTPRYTCNCDGGWTGTYCDADINECSSNPCVHGACNMPLINFWNCTCEIGWEGKKCDQDIQECASSPCINSGVCTEPAVGQWKCTCNADWTGERCEEDMDLWTLKQKFKGTMDISSVEDILKYPQTIVDSVPFLVGQMNSSAQYNLSWTHDDIFSHCVFAGQTCENPGDTYRWFSPTLGNCFTFNHANVFHNYTYMLKRAGLGQGLELMLNIRQAEYVPWQEVSGARIFVHNQSESISSESVNYQAPPGYETTLGLVWTVYKLKGEPYSKCVSDKSALQYYYSDGEYSTEACLRSCYQKEIFSTCECMDPRYPQDSTKTTCPLEKRRCVEDFVASKGNPKQWDCSGNNNCPLPCYRGEYTISTSKAEYPKDPQSSIGVTKTEADKDYVKIEIYFEDMSYIIFSEKSRYPTMKLLSDIGGQLGILCGMSVISMTEILFTLIQVIIVFFTGLH